MKYDDVLSRLGVEEKDLRETFVRSGGKGGQNVNKVATCVLLVHIPTGLQVRAETERTQAANREEARRRLAEMIVWREEEMRTRERQAREKIRRTNRPLSRGAKRRRLEEKRHRSAIKSGRRFHGDSAE